MSAQPQCGYYDFVENVGKTGEIKRCPNTSTVIVPFVWKDESSGLIRDLSNDNDTIKQKDKGPFPYPLAKDNQYWHRCDDHKGVKWVDSMRDREAVVKCVLPIKGDANFRKLITLIVGHTGCGKTVGTPLFLVEEALKRNLDCSFYVAVVTITYIKYFRIFYNKLYYTFDFAS